MLKLIACIDKFNSIGINNDLIYKFSDDLKIFKQKTINNTIVMGRKTFESLKFKPLPNRKNIIISKTLSNPIDNSYIIFQNIDDVFKINNQKNIFIIGGKQIYEYFNNYYEELHLTIVKGNFTKDYNINKSIKLNINLDNFKIISSKEFNKFHINVYKRLP